MGFCTLLVMVLTSGPLSGQTVSPPEGGGGQIQPVAMSNEIRYGLLFRLMMRFENRADSLSRQGKVADSLRSHWRDQLGLPESQYGTLLATARTCVAEVDELDSRAAAIIQATKERYRGQPRGADSRVGPLPQELIDLENRRKEVVLAALAQLKASLGAEQFMLFDGAVRRSVGQAWSAAPAVAQQ
jgi:hypothetical protein